MLWPRKFHIENLTYLRVPEPGKLFKGQEQFSVPEQEPEPMTRDISNFHLRSGLSLPRGFHLHASESSREQLRCAENSSRNSRPTRFPAPARISLPRFRGARGHASVTLPARKRRTDSRHPGIPSDSPEYRTPIGFAKRQEGPRQDRFRSGVR